MRLRFWRDRERELDEEIQAHLRMATAERIESGMSPAEAESAAREEFGNVALVKDVARDVWAWRWLQDSVHDIRYAARTFRRAPVFAGAAMMTLAVGIGASTAIFAVVNAVLLRPLPYNEADRLVLVLERSPEVSNEIGYAQSLANIDMADLQTFRAQAHSLSHIGVFVGHTSTVTGVAEQPVRVEGTRLSPAVLDMLGVAPVLGRMFRPYEEDRAADPVVILSHTMWKRYFGSSEDVLGRSMSLDQRAHTIVGVMPPAFQFPDAQTLFWVPYVLGASARLPPIARLADGVSLESASANVDTLMRQLRLSRPPRPGASPLASPRFELESLQEHLVAPAQPALVILATAVVFLLLIACVNVANLLLARNVARRRELTVRSALGASRGRLARQLLTEGVLLAGLGGAGGIVIALQAVSLLQALGTSLARRDLTPGVSIPRLEEVSVDGFALSFAIAASVGVGLLVAILPVMRLRRSTDSGALHQAGTIVYSPPGARVHGLLLVAEVSWATVLLIGSGLLASSFLKLSAVDPGYDPRNLVTFTVHAPGAQASPGVYEAITERLQAVPGVKAAGYAELLPMVRFRVGGPLRPAQPMPTGTPPAPAPIDMRVVSRDFVAALGMRLVEGRTFRESDGPAVLINRTLARSGFIGPRPVGMHVYPAASVLPYEVIGIVEDVHQYGLDQAPDPQVFVDVRHLPMGNPGPYFAVRVERDPLVLLPAFREAVRQLDRAAVLHNVVTMEQVVSNSISRPRLLTAVAVTFAAAATLLTAIGIYGVIAYLMTQRTREFGIRIALGADSIKLLGAGVRQGLTWIAMGLALGLLGATLLTRYLTAVLFGVAPTDPMTFVSVSLLVIGIAVVATAVPTWRVIRADPLVALRCE